MDYIIDFLISDIEKAWKDNNIVTVIATICFPKLLLNKFKNAKLYYDITDDNLDSKSTIIITDNNYNISQANLYLTLLSVVNKPIKTLAWTSKVYKIFGDHPVFTLDNYIKFNNITPKIYYTPITIPDLRDKITNKTLIVSYNSKHIDKVHDVIYVKPYENLDFEFYDTVIIIASIHAIVPTLGGGSVESLITMPEIMQKQYCARSRKSCYIYIEKSLVNYLLPSNTLLYIINKAKVDNLDIKLLDLPQLAIEYKDLSEVNINYLSPVGPKIEEWRINWNKAGGNIMIGYIIAIIYDTGESAIRMLNPKQNDSMVTLGRKQTALLNKWSGNDMLEKNLSVWSLVVEKFDLNDYGLLNAPDNDWVSFDRSGCKSNLIKKWIKRIQDWKANVKELSDVSLREFINLDLVRKIRSKMGNKDIDPGMYLSRW